MNAWCILLFWMLPDTNTLTLEQCMAEAICHHPLQNQTSIYDAITRAAIANLNARYLPEFNLSAQATYQSEVITLPVSFPGIEMPQPLRDAYQVSVSVKQLIWDFGRIAAQKEIEKAQNRLDRQTVRVEVYKIRQAVADAFFAILMYQAKEQSLRLTETDVQNRLKDLRARVDAGIALSATADIFEAEAIRIRQQITDVQSSIQTSKRTLGELMGRSIEELGQLILPELEYRDTETRHRPEYAYFQASVELLTQMRNLNQMKYRPRIVAFGQYSYARPGLNYFNRSFEDNYYIGLKTEWNVWSWNTDQREAQILRYRQNLIRAQEQWFTKNLTLAQIRLRAEIQTLQTSIANDRLLIEIRERITRHASAQLDKGVITATEYLTELNAEHQARLMLDMHRIQLMQAIANYQFIRGEEK